ncbi:hypothetical protein [Kitasatospora indigofera]|uniref:hypothetical protein n=1 Tax=Kitasatospora indigofera TaxID=67307 RepID=UPI0033B2246A
MSKTILFALAAVLIVGVVVLAVVVERVLERQRHSRAERARQRLRTLAVAAAARHALVDFQSLHALDLEVVEPGVDTVDKSDFFVPTVPVGHEAELAAQHLNAGMERLFARLGPPPDAAPDDGTWGVGDPPPGAAPDEPTSDDSDDLSERARR